MEKKEKYEIIPSRPGFDLPEPKFEVTEPRRGPITGGGINPRREYPAEVNPRVQ